MLRKINWFLLLLIILSLFPLKDFLAPGLPITHDGQDHVARIANFYQSLAEGNIVPRWASNLNWGYGHPILMFLYPLPSYFASFFHFLNFSLVDSTKIVFGLSFILSGIFMYLWIKEIWGAQAGFLAALIYMFAPYRFVDLYVRGAIGECWAFVWPPLICYFLLKLFNQLKWQYLVGGSLSLAVLLLSHNALSLMFLPVIFGYTGYLVLISKKKLLLAISYLLLAILGFAESAFFWFPAFFEGKYTLRDTVTRGSITGFESFSRLLWSPWSYGGTGAFSVQLGLIQWLIIVLTPFLIYQFWRRKDKIWLFLSFLFICFWLAILLVLPLAQPIYFKISLLQKFQFAWRFLSLAIFPPAIFAGALAFLLPKKVKFFALCFISLVILFSNKDYWRAKDYLLKPDSFYTQAYPGTTDTGESAPRWSVRFMEEFPKAHLEIIEGKAKISEESRITTRHEYQIEATTPLRLVDNTLYFPGWQVLVDNQVVEIQFQDPGWRGLMTFNVSRGNHTVVVRFTDTKLRRLANFVSLVSLTILFFSLPVIKLLKK